MIDEQLIAQETLNLTTSVLSKQFTLAPGLFLLKNVFSQSALDKLKIFLDNKHNLLIKSCNSFLKTPSPTIINSKCMPVPIRFFVISIMALWFF